MHDRGLRFEHALVPSGYSAFVDNPFDAFDYLWKPLRRTRYKCKGGVSKELYISKLEMNVFEIKELRKEIFSYLRKKPAISCAICLRVCQWDETSTVRLDTIKCFGVTQCAECYKMIEYEENNNLIYYSDYP